MRWPSAESLWRPAGAALPPLVRTPRRLPRPVGRSGASPIMLAAAVLLLGLGGLLAYLLLPEETVVLYPIGRPIDEALEIRADPALPDVDPARARVPARIGYVVVDVVEQAQTLGRLPAPDARAVGSVTFANRQGGAATVPAGTFLLTASGARFATQAEATLDAAPGSTARVGVQAIEPGEPGNVGRLEINRIVGPLAGQLAVLNEEATVGGGQSSTPLIVDADVARVRQLASEHARSDALTKLQAEVGPDASLILQTLDFTLLDEQLDRRVGDRVGSFNYRLRARVSGAQIASGDVERVVRAGWRPTIPPGYRLPPAQLQIGAPQVAGTEGRAVVLRVPVRSVAVPPVDADAIKERVRWRDPDEARRDLARSFAWAAEPRLTVQPRWAVRALRVRLAIDMNDPAPPAASPTAAGSTAPGAAPAPASAPTPAAGG